MHALNVNKKNEEEKNSEVPLPFYSVLWLTLENGLSMSEEGWINEECRHANARDYTITASLAPKMTEACTREDFISFKFYFSGVLFLFSGVVFLFSGVVFIFWFTVEYCAFSEALFIFLEVFLEYILELGSSFWIVVPF